MNKLHQLICSYEHYVCSHIHMNFSMFMIVLNICDFTNSMNISDMFK